MTASRTHVLAPLLAVALGLGTLVGTAQPAAAATGKISGVVSAAGVPQAGVKIRLLAGEDSKGVVARAVTRSDGSYRITGVTTDRHISYLVYYDDPARRIVAGERVVRPRAGKTVRRNITAKEAGTIRGTIAYPDSTPAGSGRVELSGPTGGSAIRGNPDDLDLVYRTSVTPGADGRFVATGLPAGRYRLTYRDAGQRWFPICNDGSPQQDDGTEPSCSHATPVTVTTGGTVTVPPRTFNRRAASIAGTVSGEKVSKGYFAYVRVQAPGAAEPVATVPVRSTGRYRAIDLPAGTWNLRVEPTDPDLEARWYRAARHRSDADPITTSTGQRVSGIDFVLRSKSRTTVDAVGKPGRATFTVTVLRRSTGRPATGSVEVTIGGRSKAVRLTKGTGRLTISGQKKGKRSFTATYAGGRNVAPSSRTGTVTIR